MTTITTTATFSAIGKQCKSQRKGRPIIEPNDYEHVISFYNGSCAVIISQDRFYSSMRVGHKYNASDFESLDAAFKRLAVSGYGLENPLTCQADGDVNPDAPICIGMDYNANINWIVAYDI